MQERSRIFCPTSQVSDIGIKRGSIGLWIPTVYLSKLFECIDRKQQNPVKQLSFNKKILKKVLFTRFSYLLFTWQTWNIFNTEFYWEQIDGNLFYWASIKRALYLNVKRYLLWVIYILLEQGTAKEETKGKEELTFILKQTNEGRKIVLNF